MKIRVKIFIQIIIILFAFIFQSCSASPEPIEYGSDGCAHCKMIISDKKYGAELVTSKGKIYKFDSAECLADFLSEEKLLKENIHSILVTNFQPPNEFLNAEKAYYLKNEKFHSPMGMNILAVKHESIIKNMMTKFGGEQLEWRDVIKLVN